jgi:NAD(P)-dependent dehydrogenase (short-subunit alcohol dehydrogenase family)
MAGNRNMAGMIAFGAAAGGALMLARATLRRERDFDFRGKIAIVTGGSRGLGLVLGRQLASRGARVVICARDPEELEVARLDIQSHGGDVLAIPCDLAQRDEVKRMVSQVIDEFGRIDVLINNAGTIAVGPIEAMKLDAYQYSMDTIFWSAVHTAYYVVPHMQRQGGGRIVNISSIGGKVGVPHLAPYCAAKFAVTGWSRALRGELMKDGIVVTTICPGLMRTGSPRNAEFKGQHQAEYAWFKIGDSLPFLSMSAEHAASRILAAAQQGEVEVVLGLPAKVAVVVDQLFPEISGDLAVLAGRLLPAMGGIGTESRRGAESESSASRNILTQSTDRAAERNNEVLR